MTVETDPNPFRLVTVKEAAKLMSLSERQVQRLIAEKAIPVHRFSPGAVRVPWWLIVQQISQQHGYEIELAPNVAVTKAMKH